MDLILYTSWIRFIGLNARWMKGLNTLDVCVSQQITKPNPCSTTLVDIRAPIFLLCHAENCEQFFASYLVAYQM